MNTFLYEIASFSDNYLGYVGSTALPFFFLVFFIVRQVKLFSFNLPLFAIFFLLLPTFTPILSSLAGFDYFTMLNYELQTDLPLKIAAVYLVCLFTIFFILGSRLPNTVLVSSTRRKMIFPLTLVKGIMILNFILIFLFLEAGSILVQSYGTVKFEGEAPYSSLVNQFFNCSVAFFISYIGNNRRQRTVAFFFLVMVATFLVFSRRTTAIGVIVLLIYTLGAGRLSLKQLALLFIAGGLLIFVGEARTVGIVDYIQGVRMPSSIDLFFSLPGGASNIFVGSMGVVDLVHRDILSFPESFPIVLWPTRVYESSIYADYYQYNGGMHIANVFYWNFGIFGLIIGGTLLGWVTMRVHIIAMRIKTDLAGTLGAMLSIAYILALPNLLWYNPIGVINSSIAVSVVFFLVSIVKK